MNLAICTNRQKKSASGCIAGDYIVYVTTKDPAFDRRQPWTAVYKTNLVTGKTDRLTPPFQADLSPSVSPNGEKIAVASFQKKAGWNGERENLKTDIFVMNVNKPFHRKLVIENGGWPTWGDKDVLFFHRKVGDNWAVFRAEGIDNMNDSPPIKGKCVTPKGVDAITPAAISRDRVAAAVIRKKSALLKFTDIREDDQYRHIEIFDYPSQSSKQITKKTRPKADHYNPFIINDNNAICIGYHRCKDNIPKCEHAIAKAFDKLKSPHKDIGLFRVSGVFPTFSTDGTKLAFVDNHFKNVWLADDKGPLRIIYKAEGENKLYSPVWNQNPEKDTLYVCMGPSFSSDTVHICAIPDASSGSLQCQQLTKGYYNNAFPSTNPEGTKLVFRSNRVGGGYKNLYIMEDAQAGEYGEGKITTLTKGSWMDSHCKWSPRGDWIVFSSNRDRPHDAPKGEEDLDSGYYAVYLVKANDPSVVVRVVASGSNISGHATHPFFSPDGRSIVFVSDLAAVSVDPISLPHFLHSARPYGDIFTVDIDTDDITKNENIEKFHRITHTRYENATGTWTKFSTRDPYAAWNLHIRRSLDLPCPYINGL